MKFLSFGTFLSLRLLKLYTTNYLQIPSRKLILGYIFVFEGKSKLAQILKPNL